MDSLFTLDIFTYDNSGYESIGTTKPDVVVTVGGIVVVTVPRSQVIRIIIPRAAAFHTVGTFYHLTLFFQKTNLCKPLKRL